MRTSPGIRMSSLPVPAPPPHPQTTSPARSWAKSGGRVGPRGATLGRTATAAILPGKAAFAIDTMKTRAGEHNVDEATQHPCGAVRGLLLAACGRPRSFAEL